MLLLQLGLAAVSSVLDILLAKGEMECGQRSTLTHTPAMLHTEHNRILGVFCKIQNNSDKSVCYIIETQSYKVRLTLSLLKDHYSGGL